MDRGPWFVALFKNSNDGQTVIVHSQPQTYAIVLSNEGWYLSEMMGPLSRREDAQTLATLWSERKDGPLLYAHFHHCGLGYWRGDEHTLKIPSDVKILPIVKDLKLKRR